MTAAMKTFGEASALIASHVAPLEIETVPLSAGAGRVLAADIRAAIPSPRHSVSAMDGYAVRESDIAGGEPVQVAGEARPGAPFAGVLPAGEAVRIFTGAPLPDGADCVIMQEYAQRDADTVRFAAGFGPAKHVRQRGSDFEEGAVLLRRGTRLDAKTLVAAAAADVAEITVHRQPAIAIIATGDELAEPGSAQLAPYAIPDTTSLAIASLAQDAGARVTSRCRAQDDLPALERQAGELLESADIVIVIGGASVGDRDFAKPMFAPHGLALVFDRLAIKPGKPLSFGRIGQALFLGLPGNPVAAFVTWTLFAKPLCHRLSGATDGLRTARLVRADTPLQHKIGRCEYRPATIVGRDDQGREVVHLGPQVHSAQLAPLVGCDGLVRLPGDVKELPLGSMLEFLPFEG